MDISLLHCLLPNEILRSIFDCLEDDNDIKRCKLVCKRWYHVLTDGRYIRINVPLTSLVPLLNALRMYPTFGLKISSIKLITEIDFFQINNAGTFRSVVERCPNVCELYFGGQYLLYDVFIGVLSSLRSPMAKIQRIEIIDMCYCPHTVKLLHSRICWEFRETITHLEIWDLEYNDVIIEKGGLHWFVLWFPNLKCLIVKTGHINRQVTISLASVLGFGGQNIEELKIYGVDIKVFIETADVAQHYNNTVMKTLVLDIFNIDTNTVKYITNRLKKLKTLRIKTWNYLIKSEAEDNSKVILNEFKDYCDRVNTVDVRIRDQGQASFKVSKEET